MSEILTAEFSECRRYRYTLTRRWAPNPMVQFVCLNPSTATELIDDPTVRRVKRFAADWGYGGVVMTNLFAWRSTDPAALKVVPEPVGERGIFITVGGLEFDNRNDFWLYTMSRKCALTVAAWGTHGALLYRGAKVKQMLCGMKCLALTAGGFPKHPLYVRADAQLVDFGRQREPVAEPEANFAQCLQGVVGPKNS